LNQLNGRRETGSLEGRRASNAAFWRGNKKGGKELPRVGGKVAELKKIIKFERH